MYNVCKICLIPVPAIRKSAAIFDRSAIVNFCFTILSAELLSNKISIDSTTYKFLSLSSQSNNLAIPNPSNIGIKNVSNLGLSTIILLNSFKACMSPNCHGVCVCAFTAQGFASELSATSPLLKMLSAMISPPGRSRRVFDSDVE